MNLLKLATKNIKHNFRHYLVYLISISFSVAIFNLFISVFMDEKVQKLISENQNYESVFQVSAIVVALFSVIFVWYSNSFFIKSRQKEIGLYSLLGVRQGKIGRMMFYETIVLGFIAIITGSITGITFSKFFSMLLLKILNLDTNIDFVFSIKPLLITIVVFLGIFIIASLHGYSLIYRYKLIDLFTAGRKSEKVKRPNIIVALSSVIMIGYSYYLALSSSSEEFIKNSLVVMVLLIVGTILLFSSFFVYLVYQLQKNKNFYYKNLNVFSISQIVYRIKGNALTLAIVAISITMAIFTSTFTYLSYQNTLAMTYLRSPFSFVYRSTSEEIDGKVSEIIKEDKKHKLINSFEVNALGGMMNLQDQDRYVHIIDETTANNIMEHHNKEKIRIKDSKSIYYLEFLKNPSGNQYVDKSINLLVGDKGIENLKIEGFYDNFRMINEGGALWNYVVVSNEAYNSLYTNEEGLLKEYRVFEVTNAINTKELTEKISNIVSEESNFDSFYLKYIEQFQSNGMMLFIGGFLAVLFLTAMGSILYFKQLMDANNDHQTYITLKKLGVSKTIIKKSLLKQMAFIFIAPLMVALVHSFSLLKVMKELVEVEGVSANGYTAGVILTFVLLYLIYYLMTVQSFYKVVSQKR